MAKKKDSEKHEDGQKGKYNKDDADANDLENFVDDISDEGNTVIHLVVCEVFSLFKCSDRCLIISRITWGRVTKKTKNL